MGKKSINITNIKGLAQKGKYKKLSSGQIMTVKRRVKKLLSNLSVKAKVK